MKRLLSAALLLTLFGCHSPVTYHKEGFTQSEFDSEYMGCVRFANLIWQAPIPSTEYYRVRGIIGEEVFRATIEKQRNWPAELWAAHMADARRNAIVDSCMEAEGYWIENAW